MASFRERARQSVGSPTTGQVLIATFLTVVVVLIGLLLLSRVDGHLPGWSALPLALVVGLIEILFIKAVAKRR